MHVASPVRIFIGSSTKNRIEEKVLIHSIKRFSKRALEIHVFRSDEGRVLRFFPDGTSDEIVLKIPAVTKGLSGATRFSLCRLLIPEMCEYQGKAIYLDSDQMLFTDIGQLFNQTLNADVLAVPLSAAIAHRFYSKWTLEPIQRDRPISYLSSVMLLDCAKLSAWKIENIIQDLEKSDISYLDLMFLTPQAQARYTYSVSALPAEWNCLDVPEQRAKLLHFTDLRTQPWIYSNHVCASTWEAELCSAFDAGDVKEEDLVFAIQHRYAKPWLLKLVRASSSKRAGIQRAGRVQGWVDALHLASGIALTLAKRGSTKFLKAVSPCPKS